MNGADSRKELNMKLSDEYYQILFHIYDTMLKWEFYNEQQKNYIINNILIFVKLYIYIFNIIIIINNFNFLFNR